MTRVRSEMGRAVDVLARAITLAGVVACVILALHILFVVFSANEGNSIVSTANDWAHWLAWQFRDVFTPKDEKTRVLVNYGLAAIVYLVAARLIAGLVRRLG